MARPTDEILHAAHSRAADQAEYTRALRVIDEGYEGKIEADTPELRENEPVAVANMLVQGVDQHGMRIASTSADPTFPALSSTKASVSRAEARRRAVLGMWDENAVDVQDHRRARWLIAYAKAPIQVVPRRLRRGDPLWTPDNEWMIEWRLRAPHDTFPAPCSNPDDMTPRDCIFRYSQSMRWVTDLYPESEAALRARVKAPQSVPGRQGNDDDVMVEIIEYVDGDETVLIATGSTDGPRLRTQAGYGIDGAVITHLSGSASGSFWGVELDRYENRTGLCPVVIPQRITLGKPQGQFDQMVGMFQEQAHLMALELNAVQRGIFPDTYAVESPQNQGNLKVEPADGLTGLLGKVYGGDIKTIQLTPGFQTYPTIDRLAESMRVQALIPPDFGGQSGSNIRTARRGADIISSTVDFSIMEAQLLFQRSKKHEFVRAIEQSKAYFGKRRKVYAVGWPGAKGTVDYRPNDIFEAGATFSVDYAAVGSDRNMLNVNIMQATSAELFSKQTGRRKHPDVEDPDFEERQIDVEKMRAMALDALGQKVVAGMVTDIDLTAAIRARADGDTVEDAIDKADQAARERTATSGPPGTPTGPVDPTSPEAQAGLAPPGAGAEAGTFPAPSTSRDHMVQLLSQASTLRNAGTAA